MFDLSLITGTLTDLISEFEEPEKKSGSAKKSDPEKRILRELREKYARNKHSILGIFDDLKNLEKEQIQEKIALDEFFLKRLNELFAVLVGRGINQEQIYTFYNSWIDVQTALYLIDLQASIDALRLLSGREKREEDERAYRENLKKILDRIRKTFSALIEKTEDHWKEYYDALGKLKEIELEKELVDTKIEEEVNKKASLERLQEKRLAAQDKKIEKHREKFVEAERNLSQAENRFDQSHTAKTGTSRDIIRKENRLAELKTEKRANEDLRKDLGVQLGVVSRAGNVTEARVLEREIDAKKVRHTDIVVEETSITRELQELRDIVRAQQDLAQEHHEAKAAAQQQVTEAKGALESVILGRAKIQSYFGKLLHQSSERIQALESKRERLVQAANKLRPVVEDLHQKAKNAHAATKSLLAEGDAAARELEEGSLKQEQEQVRQLEIRNKEKELALAEMKCERMSREVEETRVLLRRLERELSGEDDEDEHERIQSEVEALEKSLESHQQKLAKAEEEKQKIVDGLQVLRNSGASADCNPVLVDGFSRATGALAQNSATAHSLAGTTEDVYQAVTPTIQPASENTHTPSPNPPPYTATQEEVAPAEPPPAYHHRNNPR
jgi:hypothetical protein